jgi:hypothetical protein
LLKPYDNRKDRSNSIRAFLKQPFHGWKEKMIQNRFMTVQLAITLMIGLMFGCSPKKSINQPGTNTANTSSVQVTLDEQLASSVELSTTGGTLTALGADGTRYTLTFPKGALLNDERITLTPAATIDGLPFSGVLAGGVQMAPEGLRLYAPATLIIESPKTVAAKGFETVAFAYHEKGEGLYLNPSEAQGNKLTLELWHFSGAGAAQGTSAEIQSQQQQHVPSNAEDAFTQRVQEYLALERQAQLLNGVPGQTPDPAFGERMRGFLREAYDSFIAPQLPTALTDCAAAPAILSKALGWSRQVQLMLGETAFTAEIDKIYETIDQVRINCTNYRVDGVYWGAYHLTGLVCKLDKPFTLNSEANLGGAAATGAFKFTPSGRTGGTWSFAGLMEGLQYNASSTYELAGLTVGAPVIVMNPGSNWTITVLAPVQVAGTYPLGGGTHLGSESARIDLVAVETNECGR